MRLCWQEAQLTQNPAGLFITKGRNKNEKTIQLTLLTYRAQVQFCHDSSVVSKTTVDVGLPKVKRI